MLVAADGGGTGSSLGRSTATSVMGGAELGRGCLERRHDCVDRPQAGLPPHYARSRASSITPLGLGPVTVRTMSVTAAASHQTAWMKAEACTHAAHVIGDDPAREPPADRTAAAAREEPPGRTPPGTARTSPKPLRSRSCNRVRDVFRNVPNEAMRDGRVGRNAAELAKPIPLDDVSRRVILKPEHFPAFVEMCERHDKGAFWTPGPDSGGERQPGTISYFRGISRDGHIDSRVVSPARSRACTRRSCVTILRLRRSA